MLAFSAACVKEVREALVLAQENYCRKIGAE